MSCPPDKTHAEARQHYNMTRDKGLPSFNHVMSGTVKLKRQCLCLCLLANNTMLAFFHLKRGNKQTKKRKKEKVYLQTLYIDIQDQLTHNSNKKQRSKCKIQIMANYLNSSKYPPEPWLSLILPCQNSFPSTPLSDTWGGRNKVKARSLPW